MAQQKDVNSRDEFKKLLALVKSGKATEEEVARFEELKKKKGNGKRDGSRKPRKPGGPGNDFSWWNKVPELLNNASNLKSNWIAGMELAGTEFPFRPAGVIRCLFRSTYGCSRYATDPLTVWARDLYLKMFQKWRGISSYSQSDLGIAIIASLEVVKMIAKLERIYGVVNRYSKSNLNMPFTEQAALNLSVADSDWIRGHLADYRYDLNELIRKAQRLCVPADISVIQNSISLLGYEYLDHDNVKAQIILFDTLEYGVFDETTLTTGGCIRFGFENAGPFSGKKLINTSGSSDNMFEILDTMLNALLNSTSIQRIYGDLLTWFGEEQLLKYAPLPDDFIIAPVHSESILHKLHNMELVGSSLNWYTAPVSVMPAADISAIKAGRFIYQYNDSIVANVYLGPVGLTPTWVGMAGLEVPVFGTTPASNVHTDGASIIDTYRVDPDAEVITEGALWKYTAERIQNGSNFGANLTSMAFEVFTQINVYTADPSQSSLVTSTIITVTNNATMAQQYAGILAVIDWAPLMYVILPNMYYSAVYGDIDTPIPLHKNTCEKLQRAIVYSGLQTDVKVIDKVHN